MLNTVTKQPSDKYQNVNHGFHLKWKLNDKKEEQGSTMRSMEN